MAFHERAYDVYAILVGSDSSRPWLASCWRSISEAIGPVLSAARDRPAVRSTQLGGIAPRMRSVSFGRITHDEKGAAKWTHEKDGQLLSGKAAHFLSSEIWAPSWNACERDGMAPDVYLCISNERLSPSSGAVEENLHFSSVCLLAVACELGEHTREDGRRAATSLVALLASPLTASSKRSWGQKFGSVGFTNAINDLAISGLFNPGPRHATPPTLHMFSGDWTLFESRIE